MLSNSLLTQFQKTTSCANLPIQCDVLRLGKSRAEALLGSAPAGLVPLCSRGIVRANPFFRLCAGGETRRWGHWQKRGLPRSKHSG
jgi:hypothetical protein